MQISFIAGYGPIARSVESSHAFWADMLGISFTEPGPGYFHTEELDGARAFAVWPLEQAASSVFGEDVSEWPAEIPAPQAWIEVDVASPEAVADAVAELEASGATVLRGAATEPWGQVTSRLLTPEGLLLGITFTPWMHGDAAPEGEST